MHGVVPEHPFTTVTAVAGGPVRLSVLDSVIEDIVLDKNECIGSECRGRSPSSIAIGATRCEAVEPELNAVADALQVEDAVIDDAINPAVEPDHRAVIRRAVSAHVDMDVIDTHSLGEPGDTHDSRGIFD